MPSIAVVYHLCANSRNLRPSLRSFAELKGAEFILCDDRAEADAREAAAASGVAALPDFRHVSTSQGLGHSYAFNFGAKLAEARYVYFADSQTKVKPEFAQEVDALTAKHGHADVIVLRDDSTRFFSARRPLEVDVARTFLDVGHDLVFQTDWGLSNKLFSREFLLKHRLEMPESHYYPAPFVLSALARSSRVLCADRLLTEFRQSTTPDYNVYDYLFQILDFYELCKKYNWGAEKRRAVEFWGLKAALYDFPAAILNARGMTDEERETALVNALKTLDRAFPDWKKNPYLELVCEDKWRAYFKKFKPRLAWVRREFDTK